MLDALFELGQVLSLIALASGLMLRSRVPNGLMRRVTTGRRLKAINLLKPRIDNDAFAAPSTAVAARPEHVKKNLPT